MLVLPIIAFCGLITSQVLPDVPPSGQQVEDGNVNPGIPPANDDTVIDSDPVPPSGSPTEPSDGSSNGLAPPPSVDVESNSSVPQIDTQEEMEDNTMYPGLPGCKTYRLREPSKHCPQKYEYVEEEDRCERIVLLKAERNCPDGYIKEEGGIRCIGHDIQPKIFTCEEGFENLGKMCRKVDYSNQVLECPNGYFPKETYCSKMVQASEIVECPQGTVLKEDGLCLGHTTVDLLVECLEGYTYLRGMCTRIKTEELKYGCSTEETLVEEKKCGRTISAPAAPFCPKEFDLNDEECHKRVQVKVHLGCPNGTDPLENGMCLIQSEYHEEGCLKGDCFNRSYVPALHQCPDGFREDERFETCIGFEVKPAEFNCPEDYELVSEEFGLTCQHLLINDAQEVCPTDYVPHDGRCKLYEAYKPTNMCPKGTIHIDEFRCERIDTLEPRRDCPLGFDRDANGNCIAERILDGSLSCPYSYEKMPDRRCRQMILQPPVSSCPINYTADNGACYRELYESEKLFCPTGYTYKNDHCQLMLHTGPEPKCDEGIYESTMNICYICE